MSPPAVASWGRHLCPPPCRRVDDGPGACGDHSFFSTQNLFGKMADILEKIKK